uniref:general transcription factor II-I repeat domain-containing protein 2A-like n=1 Tax=Styela clava TaxID=7725 RepID=UPI00193A5B0D|nr:general transcription factor II-I repeat domain-containing protein 2A-like [Styela clava]
MAQTAESMVAKLEKQQSFFTRLHASNDAAVMASFVIAHKIAQNSKPFSEGEFVKECLVETAAIVCPDKTDAFKQVPLSRRTVTRRVECIAGDLRDQLLHYVKQFDFFTLALDESCDVRDTAQLLIFVRGITCDFKITEEIAAIRPMKETTTGADIFSEVDASMDKLGLKWEKLAGVTTDGCPNLTGKNVGLLKRMKDRVNEIDPKQQLVFLHCIIHQQVLCKSVLKISHVTDVVTKLVNFIRSRALNHRQFISLLEEQENEHTDIGYHTTVRWLSLGKILKRVWDLQQEIREFCQTKNKDIPQLSDKKWLSDFDFVVDVTALLNELNYKLQSKKLFVHNMHSLVKSFITKLQFLSRQLQNNNLAHFPTLNTATTSANDFQKYSTMLDALHAEFLRRFEDFRLIENKMSMVSSPFTSNVENIPSDAQLELIDLQCDTLLQEKFKSSEILDFYSSLNKKSFPNIRRHAQKMLVLFGSTYICEQTFSVMNFTKSKFRSSLTDEHLSDLLRISTSAIEPDIQGLVKTQQSIHTSH